MKIRTGFVSNSSSQSFVVVDHPLPNGIAYKRLNDKYAKIALKRATKNIERYIKYAPDKVAEDKKIQFFEKVIREINKHDVFLTEFLSDAGDFYGEVYNIETAAEYTHGGHSGPYNEEYFVKLQGNNPYNAVYMLKEDYMGGPKKGQQVFYFMENQDED